MGVEENEYSTTGITERVYQEPEVYQHGGDHDRHERDVPGCGPNRHGSRAGRGVGTGTLPTSGEIQHSA